MNELDGVSSINCEVKKPNLRVLALDQIKRTFDVFGVYTLLLLFFLKS